MTTLASLARRAILLSCVAGAALAQTNKPHVHIVATGGTIASTNYYSSDVGKVGVDVLLKAVPQLDSIAALSTQQFSNIASGAMTPAIWLNLS